VLSQAKRHVIDAYAQDANEPVGAFNEKYPSALSAATTPMWLQASS
jgi:hypothetical protein